MIIFVYLCRVEISGVFIYPGCGRSFVLSWWSEFLTFIGIRWLTYKISAAVRISFYSIYGLLYRYDFMNIEMSFVIVITIFIPTECIIYFIKELIIKKLVKAMI